MNKKQQKILFVSAITIVLMLFFPPFHYQFPNGAVLNLGYGFLLSPPRLVDGAPGTVNAVMLVVQWMGVLLVAGLLCYATSDNK